jgi:hypothetical protein
MPVPLPLYAAYAPPVLGGGRAEAVAAVEAVLAGTEQPDPATSRAWVLANYGVEQAVDTVARIHRDVMAARG